MIRNRYVPWIACAQAYGLCAALIACGGSTDDAIPAAAAFEPTSAGVALDSTLALLQSELDAALQQGVGEADSNQRLINAEIVSDRLLESQLPFEWLTNDGYSVEARLRQIQSMADLVVAKVQVHAARDGVVSDAEAWRDAVIELRADLREGGGDAPVPLRDLLPDRPPDTARVEAG